MSPTDIRPTCRVPGAPARELETPTTRPGFRSRQERWWSSPDSRRTAGRERCGVRSLLGPAASPAQIGLRANRLAAFAKAGERVGGSRRFTFPSSTRRVILLTQFEVRDDERVGMSARVAGGGGQRRAGWVKRQILRCCDTLCDPKGGRDFCFLTTTSDIWICLPARKYNLP